MKVKRKNVFVMEDCFEASERGVRVRVARHRSTILIDVMSKSGEGVEIETNLKGLALALLIGFKKPC